ncbi:Planctomycete cytochrome C [Pirellulimonas nuda]|uniref:Planctomycete cytochrome C n=1 Tax=Pirellulimonas nuda TaxID=2528009 RepID=A0A518D7M1_9BACT|nr:c-type cytochrome domain-containing protein [Pirellulimonas nuda]QDU87477.1 Planctomycete cytochrome C [Pirellulimonas nuda]
MKPLFTLCFSLLLFGAPSVVAAEVGFAQVEPLFQQHCVKCHGAAKSLGGLNLEGRAAVEALIEEGLLLPGDPENSEVFARLTLAEDDKLRMPKGAPPLKAEEIDAFRKWLEHEKLFEAGDAPAPAAAAAAPADEAKEPTPDPADPAAITRIEKAGGVALPRYAGSPLLMISFPSQPANTGDDVVDAILAVAPNVCELSLARTAVTDAGAARLAALENLEALHLEQTAVTDAGVAPLAGLPRLRYLNVYGSKVTDAVLEPLAKNGALRRLYVYETPVSYAAAKKAMASRPELEINLGWNHPEVARERLTQEKERLEAEKKAAVAQLEEAKAQIESADERLTELAKELEVAK